MQTARGLFLTLAVASVVVACASSPRIVNQWSNPRYASPRFKRIIVVGVSRQASLRRTFEDEFAAQLKLQGVDAVASYLYLPEDGEVAETGLQEAVQQAKADASLITRLVRVEKKTEISPGYYQPAPAFTLGFYPGYRAAWLGYYEPTYVYRYDVYISETSLYDLADNQLVWSGTVETTDPRDINKEIKRYVERVIAALKEKKLLPSEKA
ncbi:MAG TPA: DUF4136 domain-containing protein [Candidatus Saccharimonadales bacterium]|nr:DUF4136 domain-containing protein [Candidatus Saccharimonadales bacterium]